MHAVVDISMALDNLAMEATADRNIVTKLKTYNAELA